MTVNLDKREFLSPHKFGEGLKLGEQGYTSVGIQRALQFLMAVSDGRGGGDWNIAENGFQNIAGRWAGDRLAIIGDYTESDDDLGLIDIDPAVIYTLCVDSPEDLEETIRSTRESIAEYEGKDEPYYVEGWRKQLEALESGLVFTDISEEVRAAVEAICGAEENLVYKDNGGWGEWVVKDPVALTAEQLAWEAYREQRGIPA